MFAAFRPTIGRLSPGGALALSFFFLPAAPSAAQDAWPDSAFLEEFTWRPIGPANMAGRITDVEGIPGTPVFYVAAATGGIWKTTNSGITFRPLFTDERVAALGDIAIAPSDTSIVWAATGEEDSRNSISPGRGVYKSTDGGLTWELKGLEETQAIGRIVIDPRDPDVVYVAALGHPWGPNEERGLYRTRDGGDAWERIHYVSDRAGFVDLVMHPEDPDILFASSWERMRGPWFLESGGPGSALWTSTDGGDSWSEIEGGGFPVGEKGRIGVAISLSDPSVVYALVEAESPQSEEADEEEATAGGPAEEGEEKQEEEGEGEEEPEEGEAVADPMSGLHGSGLYRSEDGGRTWSLRNDQNTRPFYYSQVRVDPSDSDFVIWSSTPVRFSKDGGLTVGQTTRGIHVDQHALWWDPTNPEHIVVGNDGGIGITWDKGGNWHFPNAMPLGQFYAISYNMDIPYRVCGGLQDNGTWCGPSRRRSGPITNYLWAHVNGGDGFYAPQHPRDHDILWAESQGGNVARIDVESGERRRLEKPTWRSVTEAMRDELVLLEEEAGESPTEEQAERMAELERRTRADSAAMQLRYNWSTPLVLSPHDPDVLYVGANRVLKSTERGEGLVPISPDLSYADSMKIRVSTETTGGITKDVTGAETHATIVALAESPRRAGWLYAGTDDGRVWRTLDDGASWIELTGRFPGLPDGTWVSRIEPSHHADDRFYVTFDGHRSDDFAPYVYVTEDGGESFRAIVEGLPTGGPDYVHVIREDPDNGNLLFVGTDVAVYLSMDRGASWRPFMNGLPTVPIHDLAIHPRDRELIAGTHGRSAWIVDIGPLSRLAGRAAGEEAILFDPAPGLQFGQPYVGGEATGQGWFEGRSPRYGAEIAYYIPREVSSAILAAAREARDAAQEAAKDGETSRPATRARAEFAILDAAGDTVQVLSGAITPGLQRVYWNFRPRQVEAPLSPSERRDSLNAVRAVREIADSLIAEGRDSAAVERTTENYVTRSASSRRASFAGGAPPSPPEFEERPGESYPGRSARSSGQRGSRAGRGVGGGAGTAGQVSRAFFRALREREVSLTDFRGSNDRDVRIVDPGDYEVVLRLGDRELRARLEIRRAEDYRPGP